MSTGGRVALALDILDRTRLLSALDRPCDECNARPGEPCGPGCTALVSALNEIEDGALSPPCSCARHDDGSVTTMLCSAHASNDPCATMAAVTGRRRRGSIVKGTCSACGWTR